MAGWLSYLGIPKLSNVAQFFSLLKKDDPRQSVYYQTGVGTYTSSNVTDPVSSTIYKVGHLFAWVHAHIAYFRQWIQCLRLVLLRMLKVCCIAQSCQSQTNVQRRLWIHHAKLYVSYCAIFFLIPSILLLQDVDGDKICIFGFSRGAYTARALAGMIHKVGLLPLGNIKHVNSSR